MSGTPPAPRYFLLRVRRDGPLVPAMIEWLDHEPDNPENRLDRGRLSIYPRARIAGQDVEPERILERIGVWQRRGDMPMLPDEVLRALREPAQQTPRPIGHWAHAQTITRTEYEYQVARIKWARRHRPGDPTTQPRQPIDPAQLPLPNFDTENGRA